MPRLVAFLERDDDRKLQFQAAWALNALNAQVLEAGVVNPLTSLINDQNASVEIESICWIMSILCRKKV